MPDTIDSLITGIASSKSDIATAIEGKGVTVPSGTKLAGMASLIDQISTMHGPASSIDGNLAAFDGTSGDTLKDSGIASSAIALNSDVVHKGTNSSYVAETIYGEKSFGHTVRFGAYNAGAMGFLSEGSISSNSLLSMDIDAIRSLNLSANGNPGVVTSGFIFKDYYKPSGSSTTYTSTYKFPNKTAANKSYTIAVDEDVVHKGSSSSPSNEEIYGLKTLHDGIKLGDSSYGLSNYFVTLKDSGSNGLSVVGSSAQNISQFIIQDATGLNESDIHSYFKIFNSPGGASQLIFNNGTGNATYKGTLNLPTTGTSVKTLATLDDISATQASVTIVKDALTNINGRVLSSYEATSGTVTIGGQTYNIYTITYGNVTLTEEKARDYMEYMTGARFLPVYNYEKPQNDIFVFADDGNSLWKPQWDSTNGLILYRLNKGLVDCQTNQTINGNKRFLDSIYLGATMSPFSGTQLTLSSTGASVEKANRSYLSRYSMSTDAYGFEIYTNNYAGALAGERSTIYGGNGITQTFTSTGNNTESDYTYNLTLPLKDGVLATLEDLNDITGDVDIDGDISAKYLSLKNGTAPAGIEIYGGDSVLTPYIDLHRSCNSTDDYDLRLVMDNTRTLSLISRTPGSAIAANYSPTFRIGQIAFNGNSNNELNLKVGTGSTLYIGYRSANNVSGYAVDAYVFGKSNASSSGRGDVYANIHNDSDRRLKENFAEPVIENYTKLIEDIPLVDFNYIGNDNANIGIVAQDLEEVLPERYKKEFMGKHRLREKDGDNTEYLSIVESKLVYLCIGAIKELSQEIKELKKNYKII